MTRRGWRKLLGVLGFIVLGSVLLGIAIYLALTLWPLALALGLGAYMSYRMAYAVVERRDD